MVARSRTRDRRRSLDRATEFNGLLGEDSHFEGLLHGCANYRVAGQFTGDCCLDGVVVVEAGAKWVGDIIAENVIVDGQVAGDITAKMHIELGADAKVIGQLSGQSIVIESGAVHEGRIRMDGDAAIARFKSRRDQRIAQAKTGKKAAKKKTAKKKAVKKKTAKLAQS